MQSPTLLTYDTTTRPVWDIPFPALTICNWHQALKVNYDAIKAAATGATATEMDKARGNALRVFCDEKDHAPSANLSVELDLVEFVKNLTQKCEQMVLHCVLADSEIPCNRIFHSVPTDLGKCCSFNVLPDVAGVQHNATCAYDWSPERGFPVAENLEWVGNITAEIPLRVQASGTQFGLRLLLDMQNEVMTCPKLVSSAFKSELHSPASSPSLEHHGFLIAPGTETFVSVTPKVTLADRSVRKFGSSVRHCYLENERLLGYFKHYNEDNCLEECLANYTLKRCGCLPHFFPMASARGISVCNKSDNVSSVCLEEVRFELRRSAYLSAAKSQDHIPGENNQVGCSCLPSCSELKYEGHMTTAPLMAEEVKKQYSDTDVGNYSAERIKSDIAVVNVFFERDNFVQVKRTELYGILELFSNIGGLLGLCMGISAISFVELIYFFTVKLFST